MVSITSLEFKFLAFRYLRESGFTHSAFALGCEAGLSKSTIDGNLDPPVQYIELEVNSNHSDVDMDNNFSFLQPLDLITEDVSELQKII
ncbi:hypothetical protein AAG906_029865 [Vitis piasezkii]